MAWLSQLPPAAVYVVLALLAAVENVLPPVPSDAAVALGAFLTNRGLTTPVGVFLVTWTANLAGAAGVYYASKRYGRRLFATRTGRRLLAPRSLAIIEREYLRFGVAGIFVSRFLPGLRAVVPPFAGLVGLSPARTFIPMALASAIWYGGLIVLATLIGSNWERINQIILGINRTLGIAALVLIAVAGGESECTTPPRTLSIRQALHSSQDPRSWKGRLARLPRCSCWSWPMPTRR